MSHNERKLLVENNHPDLSIKRQTELLGISRSSVYYSAEVNEPDKQLMDLVDKIYTDCPFYGQRKIRQELKQTYGFNVGRDKIRILMHKMGLEAIYPKKKINTSQNGLYNKKYPYLLRELEIVSPNQVWSSDITYVKLDKGFVYLVAIIDWFSRYVLAWQLSNTLEKEFCVQVIEEALAINIPHIFNSDQGVQFTSQEFQNILLGNSIQISLDGRGRCFDNIFTERLWRAVKYENIYIRSYSSPQETRAGLKEYFDFYNHKRFHQSLGYKTPAQVYFGTK